MTDKILQCCYTNASQEIGGKISSGWQPVAVSENIPSEAYNTCVNLQNANSTIQGTMIDERGNVLNLFEICGDGTYIYIIRTQYGLLDRLGRANMFSHAYILSWKDEDVLYDPNSFLTIDNANFKDNEADASHVQEALIRMPRFELESAMQEAGLNAERYLTLIQCVYTQMSERKMTEPLYVQYDGTEQQMRAILYCIYYGLPHYLKKTLCAASAAVNNAAGKNIIFSEFAEKQTYYVIPQTGDNTVLSGRTERKIARYGFVDYVARNVGKIDAPAYFKRLEKIAVDLGDTSSSNELILKIAHQLMENADVTSYDGADLDGRLSDALRSKSYGSPLLEKYIAAMLNEICKRKLFLTDESEANLADRLAAPMTAELEKAGEQYNIYRFSTLSASDAAHKLSQMSKEVFTRYAHKLAETAKGLEILDLYYSDYELAKRPLSWTFLSNVLSSSSYMAVRPKTEDKIGALAWELYSQSLAQIRNVQSNYAQYMDLMKKMISAEAIRECGNAAKEEYWEHVSFENFSVDAYEDYTAMTVDTDRFKMFSTFFNLINGLATDREENILMSVRSFFSDFGPIIQGTECATAIEVIVGEINKQYGEKDCSLAKWANIAALAETSERLQEILVMREALRRYGFDEMVDAYLRLTDGRSGTENLKTIVSLLNEMVLQVCGKYDSGEHPVPLDVWAAVGGTQYDNAFLIFDKVKPAILEEDSYCVVAKSRLIRKHKYIADAEGYIRERGEEAKAVKRWLNELKQAEKKTRGDAKREEKEAPGGSIIDKGFSIFSKLTQDSDRGSNEPEADSSPDRKNKFKGFFGRK